MLCVQAEVKEKEREGERERERGPTSKGGETERERRYKGDKKREQEKGKIIIRKHLTNILSIAISDDSLYGFFVSWTTLEHQGSRILPRARLLLLLDPTLSRQIHLRECHSCL